MPIQIQDSSGAKTAATNPQLAQIKTDLSLNNVDNTADTAKPVSTAQAAAIAAAQAAAVAGSPVQSVAGRTGTVTLTKTDVGLGNVDNTADTAKPVSTAQATAISNAVSGKQDTSTLSAAVRAIVLSYLAQGANVTLTDNTTTLVISASGVGGGGGLSDGSYGGVTVSGAGTVITINDATVTLPKLANILTGGVIGRTTAGTGVPEFVPFANLKTALNLLKADVGLGNVDNTADTAKPVSTAQAAADALVASNAATALSGHSTNTANPHATTKTQVGLGNVDNTADTAKPVSTAQAAAITAAQAAAIAGAPVQSVAGKVGAVTLVKADVGLGNVDNTADTAKPVSTAQATAIAAAQAAAIAGAPVQSVAGKAGAVTLVKADVGLGNVDNTADTAKPVSTAQATAIALKANAANPAFTGQITAPGGQIVPPTAMGANAVDTSAGDNTKTVTAPVTFTWNAAPATNGQSWGLTLNVTTAAQVTFPSFIDGGTQAAATVKYFPVGKWKILFWFDGTNTYLLGGPGILSNFAGAADPVATDDSSKGYGTGSLWGRTTGTNFFWCRSAAVGAADWVAITAGGGSGTVTSVNMTVPAFLSVTGGPVTNAGTLAVGFSGTAIPQANGGTGATSAASARTALGVPAVAQVFGVQMSELPGADDTIVVDESATFAYTINSTVTSCASGTATYRLQINGTNVGTTANSVSSVQQTQAHAATNAVAIGNKVTLVRTANATCVKGSLKINCTRTLGS